MDNGDVFEVLLIYSILFYSIPSYYLFFLESVLRMKFLQIVQARARTSLYSQHNSLFFFAEICILWKSKKKKHFHQLSNRLFLGRFDSPILFFYFSLTVLSSNTIKNDGVRRPNHDASDSATLIFTMNHGGEAAAEVVVREYG